MADRRRTPAMQEKFDMAYRDVIEGGGTYFAYGYLYKAVTSGQHAAPALNAIAEGTRAALKAKGYA